MSLNFISSNIIEEREGLIMRAVRKFILVFSVLMILGIVLATFPQDSQAIPPFARKYKTACTTCHWSSFPKLNAFGRAYLANGLRMPGGADEVFVKDEPVAMGASAWSRLFPKKAVWPGDMPGMPPIGLSFSSEYKWTRERPLDPMGADDPGSPERAPDTYFNGINEVQLLSGGTLGETLSWFSVITLWANPGFGHSTVDVHRAYFNYSPFIFGEQGLVNFRFGKIEPRAVPMSNHRRQLRTTMYLMNNFPAIPVGNFFGFSPNQQGVEIWGSMNGPGGKGGFQWAAGIVNGQPGMAIHIFNDTATGMTQEIADHVHERNEGRGAFDVNNGKDWYVTASYKIGGMGVHGEESVDDSLVAKENWQDDQLTIKGYYYQGTTGAWVDSPDGSTTGNAFFQSGMMGADPNGGDAMWDRDANRFKRFGVVLDANWWNFNFIGAASFFRDDLKGTTTYPMMAAMGMPREQGDKFETDIYTAEVQYVLFPWLIPSYRLENVNPSFDARDVKSFNRHSFDIAILARANMKVLIGGSFTERPDSRSGVGGIQIATPDMPPLDDTFRIGVDIDF